MTFLFVRKRTFRRCPLDCEQPQGRTGLEADCRPPFESLGAYALIVEHAASHLVPCNDIFVGNNLLSLQEQGYGASAGVPHMPPLPKVILDRVVNGRRP